MKVKLLAVFTCITILIACKKAEQSADTAASTEITTSEAPKTQSADSAPLASAERIKNAVEKIRRGEYLNSFEMNNGEVKMSYVTNYNEFKKLNPSSTVNESDMNQVWSSEGDVLQTMVDSPLRLMRKFDNINKLDITIPYNGKTYDISVNKADLESFLGGKLADFGKNWEEQVFKKYVLDEMGKKAFFSKFGSIN